MRRTGVALLAAAVAAAGLTASVSVAPSSSAADCVRTSMPYAGIAGASLTPEDHVSKDVPPVHYTRWRGTVPGFDGMPFSVDVTVPCGVTGPQPTVVMLHGFTDDKTVWQETGKSDTVMSTGRPQTNSQWNNIWFASRGYVTVNYTARGWNDSCGRSTPGSTQVAPAPQCLPYEYWIHLDDKRWEVRDAQWLAAGLVQSGVADADRLAITGGSYGGAPSVMAGLLADKVMCGASAVPAALGVDPCAGAADGDLRPWTTPDGTTPLTWAAAMPQYTFGDLMQTLVPNGRGTDGWPMAPPDGHHFDPVGVPIQSTVMGLLAAGTAAGFFGNPGVDDQSDIYVDTARLLAGNPYRHEEPIVARGEHVYRRFKSPLLTPPQGRVPIFWVQGLTDPLFPGQEAIQVLDMVRATDPTYPFKLFLGDVGHDYTAQRQDEWDLARAEMNAFLDHFLRPDRTPTAPAYDVTSTVTRCLNPTDPMTVVTAPIYDGLHPTHATFTSTAAGVTVSTPPSRSAIATDPITTATLPLPGAYKGCRTVSPARLDETAVTYDFPVGDDLTMLGGPVVSVPFATTAPDTQLHVRLWDVAPGGSVQGLVTRGVYRSLDGPGLALSATFQLQTQGYRFAAGHTIRVEVSGNDFPYHSTSNIPAVVRVQGLTLTLPIHPG